MARLILTPSILQVGNAIGNALRNCREVIAIGTIHARHLGSHTKAEVVAEEIDLVAYHLVEIEVVGIRALEINSLRCCIKIAKRRHITTYGKAL